MKKILLVLAIMLFTSVNCVNAYPISDSNDSSMVSNYRSFLNSSGDRRISDKDSTGMWSEFYNYMGVYDDSNDYGDVSDTRNGNNSTDNDVNSKRYSVTTVAGGNGIGYIDGNVSEAKMNSVWSLICDSGHTYFIDTKLNMVRQIEDNKVTTLAKSSDTTFTKLAVNQNQVLVGGYSSVNTGIYEIYPENKTTTSITHKYKYNMGTNPRIGHSDFITFDKSNNIWFSDRFGQSGSPTNLLTARPGADAQVVGTCEWLESDSITFPRLTGLAAAIIDDNSVYVLSNGFRKLYNVQLSPRKIIEIKDYSNYFDSICVHNDNFYVSIGSDVYKVSKDGKSELYLDSKAFDYNNADPIEKITAMDFDSAGDLIISDIIGSDANPDSVSIRRININ